MEESAFQRTELLIGSESMTRLQSARVIIFGVGGVGSWCAESLIRSGIGHLTIVDSDIVNVTNINRQLMATHASVGLPKVEALRERLLAINPKAEIEARQEAYTEATAETFRLDDYDFIADAIDSLSNKMLLILRACESRGGFVSSMGAALKSDPTKISITEFWKVDGCPLARVLRKKFKREKKKPARKFACVYSPELLENKGHDTTDAALNGWDTAKARINGTMVHITAVFGFMMAGEIVNRIIGQKEEE